MRRIVMMVSVNWSGGMAFEAVPDSGNKFVMDAHREFGGKGLGPTPIEAFLSSIAACTAMDVLSILAKKQQKVTGYRIEVEGERTEEGQYPRPFVSIILRHIVTGENIDPSAVKRAVELSDEKYCSVAATLRSGPTITSEYRIEATETAPA